jgi:hypothetical protein
MGISKNILFSPRVVGWRGSEASAERLSKDTVRRGGNVREGGDFFMGIPKSLSLLPIEEGA